MLQYEEDVETFYRQHPEAKAILMWVLLYMYLELTVSIIPDCLLYSGKFLLVYILYNSEFSVWIKFSSSNFQIFLFLQVAPRGIRRFGLVGTFQLMVHASFTIEVMMWLPYLQGHLECRNRQRVAIWEIEFGHLSDPFIVRRPRNWLKARRFTLTSLCPDWHPMYVSTQLHIYPQSFCETSEETGL